MVLLQLVDMGHAVSLQITGAYEPMKICYMLNKDCNISNSSNA